MKSLASFLALINQAIVSRKSVVLVSKSRTVEKVSLFLEEKGFFSSVTIFPKTIKITFRYSMDRAPFQRMVLVSKSSKCVYANSRTKLSGNFLLTNSDSGFVLRRAEDFVGGKVLFRIV